MHPVPINNTVVNLPQTMFAHTTELSENHFHDLYSVMSLAKFKGVL